MIKENCNVLPVLFFLVIIYFLVIFNYSYHIFRDNPIHHLG
jgi:hypothetical protein